MWKCGVFWILLGNISATVRLYKTLKRPCEIKKFTVYDSGRLRRVEIVIFTCESA